MSGAKTIGEIAPKMLAQSVSGLSNGQKDVVFMRDTYNLMPVLHKSAIVLAEQALVEENSVQKDDKLKFLTKIAVAAKNIFVGGLSKHEENCHAWTEIMKEASQDETKLSVYMLFSSMFTRVYMSMPLLLPSFGKTLGDDGSDTNVIHQSLVTVLEGLDDASRRATTSSLALCGGLATNFDTSLIRKTLPTSVKELLMNHDEVITKSVAENIKK